MDLAAATGRTTYTVDLGGEPFAVGPLTLAEWGEAIAWIAANVASPIRRARDELVRMERAEEPATPRERAEIMAAATKAQQSWPPKPGTAEFFEAFENDGGRAELAYAMLRKHNRGMTRRRAAEIAEGMSYGDSALLLLVAAGGNPDDPKARKAFGLSSPTPTGDPPSDPSDSPGSGSDGTPTPSGD